MSADADETRSHVDASTGALPSSRRWAKATVTLAVVPADVGDARPPASP